MTLREMFPEWWCKVTFSVPENCSGDYNWLDFSIYEFIFTVVIVLVIKWIIYCFLFIIGIISPDKTVDATIISPSLLEKEMDIPNDEIEDIKTTIQSRWHNDDYKHNHWWRAQRGKHRADLLGLELRPRRDGSQSD